MVGRLSPFVYASLRRQKLVAEAQKGPGNPAKPLPNLLWRRVSAPKIKRSDLNGANGMLRTTLARRPPVRNSAVV